MYCTIEHNSNNRNYQSYTEGEFIDFIKKTASELNVSDLPEIVFFNDEIRVGYCQGGVVGENYIVMSLGFNSKLLNGSSYTNEQIEETVRHELSHLIADRKYGQDCGHDDRWKKVAIDCGCPPEEVLSFIKFVANVKVSELVQTEKKKNLYYLVCGKCGKEKLKSNSNLINLLGFFLLSLEENPFPLTLDNLEINTDCCKSSYRFVGEAEQIIKVLKEEDQLNSIRKVLEEMVENEQKNKHLLC